MVRCRNLWMLIFIFLLASNITFAAEKDNRIDWEGVVHFPVLNTDQSITENSYRYFDFSKNETVFYLRTFKEDLTAARLFWKNDLDGDEHVIDMVIRQTSTGDGSVDYWTCALPKQNLSEIYYVIQIIDGKAIGWIGMNGEGPNNIRHAFKPESEDWWMFDDTLLRVELTAFEGIYEDNKIELSWETTSEIDNYGFEIERSVDQEDWIKIGFIEGHGTLNSPKEYSFTDREIIFGTYYYRLKQLDIHDGFEYSPVIEVEASEMADNIALEQNYPNPFNPMTSIRFAVAERSFVDLTVYNIIGDKIITLFRDVADEGRIYDVTFDGSGLASGIYFYRLSTNEKVEIKKMILMK